jgi:hypothetical protein
MAGWLEADGRGEAACKISGLAEGVSAKIVTIDLIFLTPDQVGKVK